MDLRGESVPEATERRIAALRRRKEALFADRSRAVSLLDEKTAGKYVRSGIRATRPPI